MAKIWLVGAVTVVLALMVGAVAVALVTTYGGVDLLPADSPEGVVQRYLLALEREDYREAYDYLSSDLRSRCSFDDFVSRGYWPETRGNQVTLEKTQRFDGHALVKARVTVFHHDAPFGASEYSYERSFDLKLEEGQWRLTGPEWWCPPLF
jgi:hypothetical protein